MTIYTFAVTGMHCASCSMRVDTAIEDLPGVIRSTTTVRSGQAVVDVDNTECGPDQIIAAIASAWYTATWEQR